MVAKAPLAGSLKANSRGRAIGFLSARLVVITLFLGGTIIYQLRSGLEGMPPVVPFLYLLVGFSYLHAVISAFLLPLLAFRLFAQFQVIWDLLLATGLIYLTGGIDSLYSFLYLLVILAVSVYLPRRDVLFVACASAILYGSLLDLQYYGYLPLIGGLRFPEAVDARDVFYAVFVNVTGFLLAALLGGTLSDRLRRSQAALEQKKIDYEELENLNRAILVGINTGIMVVNSRGRIRLFNDAATRMTGFSLRDVYDLDVRTVFPRMNLYDGHSLKTERRGESEFFDRAEERKIFGYAASDLAIGPDNEPGLLVVFQDLTSLVDMEERLRRADRLAAVGRLAAGMAHEIRNPLASISGSIQLLMEESHVTAEDRRLMGIVVREADRLSALLTDFLLYARPTVPHPETFDPARLLDELADLVSSDERFAEFDLERRYTTGGLVYCDRHQLRQVLWDLLVNAAEAMPDGGVLRMGLIGEPPALFVEDTGRGISPEATERIFEPFFTTKETGTGLGLATAHSLVEANGGRIEVSQGAGRGTRFVVSFPDKRL